MTNYERLIDRDCLIDKIFKHCIDDNSCCKGDCKNPFDAEVTECKKCIAKWLDKEVDCETKHTK